MLSPRRKIELKVGPLATAVSAISTTSSPRRRPFGQPLHLPCVVSPPRPLRRLPPSPIRGTAPGGGSTRRTSGMKTASRSLRPEVAKLVPNTALISTATSGEAAYLTYLAASLVG